MKALTLHQPWASLVALGVKTVETRSWSTKYRGPLAIHAGARKPDVADLRRLGHAMELSWCSIGKTCTPCEKVCGECTATAMRMVPLGAVVATCELVDVVPMVHGTELTDEDNHVGLYYGPGADGPWTLTDVNVFIDRACGNNGCDDITEQIPYGDYRPGRFAWLLRDIKPTTERCPACWGKGWHPRGQYGPGSTTEPVGCVRCGTNGETRTCDPVPARGKQGLWEWTP